MIESRQEWRLVPDSDLFGLEKSGHLGQADGALGADRARMDVNTAETMLEFGHKCCVISEERATHGGHRH